MVNSKRVNVIVWGLTLQFGFVNFLSVGSIIVFSLTKHQRLTPDPELTLQLGVNYTVTLQ